MTEPSSKLPKNITQMVSRFDNGTYQVSTALLSTPHPFLPHRKTLPQKSDVIPYGYPSALSAFAGMATAHL